MKRYIAIVLALVLTLSVLPLAASAVEVKDFKKATHYQQQGGGFVSVYQYDNGIVITDVNGYITYSSVPGYTYGASVSKVTGNGTQTFIAAHMHEYEWTVARDGHYYKCSCGSKHNYASHIDPKDAVDGKCICGYEFMDNADLTVLWMYGIDLKPRLKEGVYEYEGELFLDYLEETKISVFTVDALATVELPKDLTLKEGTNVFEVKVTAEDGVTTNTYKVTVEK